MGTWRQFRLRRSALQKHLNAAIEHTPTITHSSPIPPDSHISTAIKSSGKATAVSGLAADNLQCHYTQLVPTSAARSQFATNFSSFSGNRQEAPPGVE